MFIYFHYFLTTQFSSSFPFILRVFTRNVFTVVFNIILSSLRTSPTLFLPLVFRTKILYVVLLIVGMLATCPTQLTFP
jgi:hypothetical protein